MNIDKIDGVIFGFALGDAWGYVTEFKKFKDIKKNIELYRMLPQQLRISDDTQMSLYNMAAIRTIFNSFSLEQLENLPWDEELQDQCRVIFADEHLNFFHDKRNNRAPGATCMTSMSVYEMKKTINSFRNIPLTGLEGVDPNKHLSNGCGTIMRAPWLGVLPLPRAVIATLAYLQAQTTHGDPRGGVTSAVAALMVHSLSAYDTDEQYEGKNLLDTFISDGRFFLTAATIIERELKHLNSRLFDEWAMENIKENLLKFNELLDGGIPEVEDITTVFGEGWAADQALYASIGGCEIYGIENIREAYESLVLTNGDSDSLAAIGGAFIGAFNGADAIEEVLGDFTSQLEDHYQKELDKASDFVAITQGLLQNS